ncbi:DMT family transporter [Halomonas sp. WWR20]
MPLHWAHATEYRAVAAITVASLAVAFHDALIKLIHDELGLWQFFIMRALFAVPLLIGLMRWRRSSLRPQRFGWVALRSLLMVTMWALFYIALVRMPLSVVASIAYTFPLLLALMAIRLPDEHFGGRGLVAMIVGFIGVLLMLRPGPEGPLTFWSLLPLGSALCYALAALVTRYRCGQESALVMSLGLNLAFVLVGVSGAASVMLLDPSTGASQPFVLSGWQPVDEELWPMLALLGLLIVTASLLTALAFQQGPPTLIATCDYCYLPFAALWSGLLLQEWPEPITLAGMGLIIGAGVLAVRTRRKSV